ncbi:MAG: cache domain-containing protein [Desulfarculus sp.]|nr:cache domain-containing protein [Desulfarculus sp.]
MPEPPEGPPAQPVKVKLLRLTSVRLILPSLLTVLLFSLAIFAIILPALEDNIMERKREMIRELVQGAYDTLSYFQQLEQKGVLTQAQAQSQARELIRHLRYGQDQKDYFWINDMLPRMVMHPYRNDLEGADISGYADPEGKRLFVEFVKVAQAQGQGYVGYMWQWMDDPKRIVPKVSYVKEFQPWGWIVGTGIYIEDVRAEMTAMMSKLTAVSLTILVTIILLSFYIIRQGFETESKRQQAEQDLKASRSMLRLVIDNVPQLVFWKDSQSVYLGCNQNFARLAGVATPQDIKGKNDFDLKWGLKASHELRRADCIVMDCNQPELHRVEPHTLPDGRTLWLETNRIPLQDAQGKVVGILGTQEDVSERREMEQALRESEKRFRELVEHSLVGISILQQGQVVYQNPEGVRLMGALPPSFRLKNLYGLHPEDMNKLGMLTEEAPEVQNGPLDMELRFYPLGPPDSSREARWVHCRANLVEHQGKPALLVIMLDITKARELEHLLRIQDKMASLGRVAAGIAHEIRNPLSGINMYLSALEGLAGQPGRAEEMERILASVKNASAKIEGVIKRVLDFARPSTPKLGWMNLNHAIETALDLASVSLRKAGITLERSLAEVMPLCYADAQLLEQVILNLLTNAAQALKGVEGPKIIEVRAAVERDVMTIAVADSGPGVPAEIREKIFDPFFSVKREGSGIGLSLSHRIVNDHGGSLRVGVSKWGGAEFVIEIPVVVYWGYDSHG